MDERLLHTLNLEWYMCDGSTVSLVWILKNNQQPGKTRFRIKILPTSLKVEKYILWSECWKYPFLGLFFLHVDVNKKRRKDFLSLQSASYSFIVYLYEVMEPFFPFFFECHVDLLVTIKYRQRLSAI